VAFDAQSRFDETNREFTAREIEAKPVRKRQAHVRRRVRQHSLDEGHVRLSDLGRQQDRILSRVTDHRRGPAVSDHPQHGRLKPASAMNGRDQVPSGSCGTAVMDALSEAQDGFVTDVARVGVAAQDLDREFAEVFAAIVTRK
jgi:hypothetical protein